MIGTLRASSGLRKLPLVIVPGIFLELDDIIEENTKNKFKDLCSSRNCPMKSQVRDDLLVRPYRAILMLGWDESHEASVAGISAFPIRNYAA